MTSEESVDIGTSNNLSFSKTDHHLSQRIITLVDLDCFYAQVEQKRLGIDSSQPLVVQQWTALIAINYAARKFGLKRGVSIEEARKNCPGLVFAHVDVIDENGHVKKGKFTPEIKANCKITLERYRNESLKILRILQRFTPLVERASIDEAYLDLTEPIDALFKLYTTKPSSLSGDLHSELIQWDLPLSWRGSVIGGDAPPQSDAEIRLLIGSKLVHKIRETVFSELGYTCSAGIGHNKKYAKLVTSYNKPNGQTVIPLRGMPKLLSEVNFQEIQGFGGKLGTSLAEYGVKTPTDVITKFTSNQLVNMFGHETGTWIHNVLRGITLDPVKPVEKVKHYGSSKNIRGTSNREEIQTHMRQLAAELCVRMKADLEMWNRVPQTVSLNYRVKSFGERQKSYSRSHTSAMPALDRNSPLKARINTLVSAGISMLPKTRGSMYSRIGMSVSNFVDAPKETIESFFIKQNTSNSKEYPIPHKQRFSRSPPKDISPSQGSQGVLRTKSDPQKKKAKHLHNMTNISIRTASLAGKLNFPKRQHEDVASDSFLCPRCGRCIRKNKSAEHDDWHFARDVQSSLSPKRAQKPSNTKQIPSFFSPRSSKPSETLSSPNQILPSSSSASSLSSRSLRSNSRLAPTTTPQSSSSLTSATNFQDCTASGHEKYKREIKTTAQIGDKDHRDDIGIQSLRSAKPLRKKRKKHSINQFFSIHPK